MVNPRVFMDFSIEGTPVGRVIFELFANEVPKTAENFRALCTGSAGVNAAGTPLYYLGSPLHRVIENFMVQGGDFTQRNGKGGESIYGGTFEDESLVRTIDSEGLLCSANKGKNTNGSQWFVSLRPCPHLDGKHVVFGRVVKGYDVIEGLSRLPVNEKDVPVQLVVISGCGELELRKAPAKKARSPSPTPSRSRSNSVASSRSRSRSRSPTPEKRKSSSSSKRHSERDEFGKRIHKKHRSKKDSSDKKKKRRKTNEGEEEKDRELTAEEIAVLEERKKVEELVEMRRKEEEERMRIERVQDLERLKEQYEKQVVVPGVVFKGRGVMKAPGDGRDRGGMRGW